MNRYETVIGLEVHAQLKTKSKIFCGCSTMFGQGPNENTCPVCCGMPGVLPVLNQKAVEFGLKMALAVECRVNDRSVFARKNYFYPDLPKGYQISQYEEPLAEHGKIRIAVDSLEKVIGITRIHMEEDAGKSIHSSTDNMSYVDLNRTGVPLLEIVSEPDIRSPAEAVAYLKSLRGILLYLEICDGNMEEGSFRCDANISLRPTGREEFGTRAEIKNLNSFRHVQKALEYEIMRQAELLDDGEAIVQETRLYDVDKGMTRSMRGKEEAHDYRYFPDPDLTPLIIDPDWVEELKKALPELPGARMQRFITQYNLPEPDAAVLTSEKELANFFEASVKAYNQPRKISNWIVGDLMSKLNDTGQRVAEISLKPDQLSCIVRMVDEGTISGKIAKTVFSEVFETGTEPEKVVKDKGLVQISDSSALETMVDQVLEAHPQEVQRFKDGQKKLMGFFVGQIMKQTKGQANPAMVNELLNRKLQ
ncbi:Asp-tRNA(Asn)/Glu-tRNA(Gln) amidotransferase subunit GatB [Desulfonatronovibrio magnus]|uniref:Asp-tRNA(Asn)/Glu-tRNA(Gln) amidotransferase subunit GatB n=1 Tax=Desulfonatronovibrio magnus TaxID=698827 RepID=UPI0005EAD9EF|nr:Asp-tRNA(Asn)/Glu-tRNA(Gln) amidotransferase subunit GatB [Desulfonatronovibrio magnus]RQD55681.1 MAG: Asp-tRNA(Asn)/Glu-tRNA(Gln) amidotransferase subunit GatB [Desulfonatronovibrio sp. MSAO_Bac4]